MWKRRRITIAIALMILACGVLTIALMSIPNRLGSSVLQPKPFDINEQMLELRKTLRGSWVTENTVWHVWKQMRENFQYIKMASWDDFAESIRQNMPYGVWTFYLDANAKIIWYVPFRAYVIYFQY